MHLAKLLATVGLASSAVIALPANGEASLSARGRSCYPNGRGWGDESTAIYHMRIACIELAGKYEEGDIKCVTRSLTKNNANPLDAIFRIRRTEGTYEMKEDDCIRLMTEQIKDCPFGGEGLWPGWAIRGDPQTAPALC